MAGKLAPGRQSGYGINAGAGRGRCPCVVRLAGAPSPWMLGNTGPMGEDSRRRGRASGLTDRRGERGVLDQLIDAVRAGGSRVLVVRGEPGVGKSALLDYLAGQASGCRVVRAAGVESEMELAFAGLHQLLAPMLDRLDRLPAPQREALRTAFGLSAGPAPDRFLVGLAVLGLVSEVADERPLICVVDDEQWLDRASAQALGFVARRLAADPVGLVFAARVTGAELAGLPELVVEGLGEEDARALLDSALTGPLDARVRDLIVAETRGNPLALLELPRGLAPAELAGGFGLPEAGPLPGRIEDSFRRQLEGLPEETRRLLPVAAADPSGDPLLVWRAAGRLGSRSRPGRRRWRRAWCEFGARVRFRHPLARSAAYRSAPLRQMQEMHAALAEATDPAADPDRRAWHRAQAAPGPDEDVAAELERSAGRAQARGGLAAAAAFLERAALLTPDPVRRAQRLIAAARAKRGRRRAGCGAGPAGRGRGRAAGRAAGRRDGAPARADRLRPGSRQRRGPAAAERGPALRAARRRPGPRDAPGGAPGRDVGRRSGQARRRAGGGRGRARRAARPRPAARGRRPARRDRAAVDRGIRGGRADADPGTGAACHPGRRRRRSPPLALAGRGRASTIIALELWDFESWHALAARQVQVARDTGALVHLQFALNFLACTHLLAGELDAAEQLIEEDRLIAEATGNPPVAYAAMMLAAWQGREQEASELIQATVQDGDRTRYGHAGRPRGLRERGAVQRPGPVRRRAGRRPAGIRARPSGASPSFQ